MSSRMLRLASCVGGTLGPWMALPTAAQACSVCIGWTGGADADWGYYWSALLLTLLPFAVVAVIGAWVRRALRRQAPARAGRRTEPS